MFLTSDSPSAGADGRLILLSPKRAMRQSVLRTDAQPLGTGRQPLNAVGRDSFPIHTLFLFFSYTFIRVKRMTAIQSLSGAFAQSAN